MDSGQVTDDDANYGSSIVPIATNTLGEFVRPFVSKKAQKTYLGIILYLVTSILMVLVSQVAYGVFYYRYIPQVGLERVVHLQFGDGYPWGTTTLGPGLVSSQAYDVSIELELPRTPSNLVTGNFMLDLTLFSPSAADSRLENNASVYPLLRSRRPAILTFSSPLVDTATKLTFMPLYVLGWQREAERLQVNMMESVQFARGWRNIPDTLRLEVHSSEKMQFYSAKVAFKARLSGLRWIMYNWKITSFVVFSFILWNTCVTSIAISWLLFASVYNRDRAKPKQEVKTEDHDEPLIKKEESPEPGSPFDSAPVSSNTQADSKRKKEEYQADDESDDDLAQIPAAGPSGDSGTGTGLESAEAPGLQRRKSRQFEEEDH
ncbi:putative adipose-regulatory protein-domain-containing protein [Aspergillus ambiguus]|uniref:seipin n=1 Tax=Aspergillus ambiguus TaxID=176160 RepID=UPI003CCD6A45